MLTKWEYKDVLQLHERDFLGALGWECYAVTETRSDETVGRLCPRWYHMRRRTTYLPVVRALQALTATIAVWWLFRWLVV